MSGSELASALFLVVGAVPALPCGTWAFSVEEHRFKGPRASVVAAAQDQTHVACIGKQILNYWIKREVL